MVTEDFVALTSAHLHNSGVVLEDRSTREHLRVHSLLELEMGRIYVSPRGNSVRRINKTHVLLAEKVPLAVDLQDPSSPGSPSQPLRIVLPGEGGDLSAPLQVASSEQAAWACASPVKAQDGPDSADTTAALSYLRMLNAEPGADTLRSLHEVRPETRPQSTLLPLSLLPPHPPPASPSLLPPQPPPAISASCRRLSLSLPPQPPRSRRAGARHAAAVQQLVRLLLGPRRRAGSARRPLALADQSHARARGGRGAGAVRVLPGGRHQAQGRHGGCAGPAARRHVLARRARAQVEPRAAGGARAAAAGGAHPARHRQAALLVRSPQAQPSRREAARAPLRAARGRLPPRVRGGRAQAALPHGGWACRGRHTSAGERAGRRGPLAPCPSPLTLTVPALVHFLRFIAPVAPPLPSSLPSSLLMCGRS